MDKRIGTMNPETGAYTYPAKTLIGQDFYHGETDPAPAVIHMLPGNHFAIGEVFYPKDFDTNAALEVLRASLAPAVPVVTATDNATGETVVVPVGENASGDTGGKKGK